MTKINEHADHLVEASIHLRSAIMAKRWDAARQHAATVSKHRSVIIAIIEAVEELQPTRPQQPPKRRYPNGHKRPGDLSRYIDGFVEGMSPGDQKVVQPNGEFTADRLAKSVSARCAALWGNGNYVTRRRDDGIEVFRVA